MTVCHTVLQVMPCIKDWQHLQQKFPSIPALLNALQQKEIKPIWFGLANEDHQFEYNGIQVYFSKKKTQLRQILDEHNPQVIHHHGLNHTASIRRLKKWVKNRKIKLVLQDHGGGFPQDFLRRSLLKKSLSGVSRIIFGDENLAQKWLQYGLLTKQQLAIVFAASSTFKPGSDLQRAQLRQKLGLQGQPIIGMVGHLDENKDPLTVLKAFAFASEEKPESQLYLHYKKDNLLEKCQSFVSENPVLKNRVHFLGECAHAQLEAFYQTIDYFVQASHHEAYGFTLAEALATGATPIVTNIPSFNLLRKNDSIGHSFSPGDVAGLTKIFKTIPTQIDEQKRTEIAQHFDANFSYQALAQKLRTLYTDA